MTLVRTKIGRRSFLKTSAAAGGGLMISFSWLAGCVPGSPEADTLQMPEEWFELNAYLKVGDNGVVTIMAPNPEFGQNVKTSMPMIVAEELDVDWKQVIVEQAPFNAEYFSRQFTGGSQGIRRAWPGLRLAGAGGRHMLRSAAAQAWQVPMDEVTTESGIIHHKKSGKSGGFGEFASLAGGIEVPEEVELKNVKDFSIVGTSQKNVDGRKIVLGDPMYAVDEQREGMLVAMIVHPPAFGLKLKSIDTTGIKSMPGIADVFTIKTFESDYGRNFFDTNAFPELAVVAGNSTWEVMNAKKALRATWEKFTPYKQKMNFFGNEREVNVPGGLESTADHIVKMRDMASKQGTVLRKNGNPEKAFSEAATVIERTYSAPFLAHNMMEPINCFAHVTNDKAELIAPIQAPEIIEGTLSERLGLPIEKIDIKLARMGGGFGRRAYGHYMVEAAVISQQLNRPIKLMYSREDDMTNGVYRPAYTATYKAALDKDNNLTAFHVKAGGIPESPLGRGAANRFPAGAVDNYLAEEWSIESNITIGAFRAPRSNFLAGAEQSFLDEVAEAAGKDPFDFRLALLDRAIKDPVGEDNAYEAKRYADVLELVREKSNWGEQKPGVSRGVSAYFCHNSYAAHVLDIKMENGTPRVDNVTCALDCGIVINPDAATNMAEGAIVDGIGNAFYGSMTFRDGEPEKSNFDTYRMIRASEAPRKIDVHFVKNEIDPTGLGEPPFPPIFGALANALYKSTGRRYYDQPFLGEEFTLGPLG